jgi:hypothetical protein
VPFSLPILIIPKLAYPLHHFLATPKSGQRAYVFGKRVSRFPNRAQDRLAILDEEFHSIAFLNPKAIPDFKRDSHLSLAAQAAARHLYLYSMK